MKFDDDLYVFQYKINGKWKNLGGKLDGKFLSTKEAGGFVGVNIGPYTTSNNTPSQNEAYVRWFKYTGNDEIYEKIENKL